MYSLSVSPDGTRLASGGLDGNVKIWSVADILKYQNKKIPFDASVCRPLCSMARHTGAVTVVKFSPDGRFLASGSDDKVLLIWEKDDDAAPVFGEQNLEHWKVTKRVVAHENDIQDIAWAPDSSILVSVGLDRSIIIWNGTTFEKIKRFDVHQSLVKGVVFDPANKYFATSSDDRSVRIFRYHKGSELSFSIERTVLQPFKKSPLTTYYRRLSWSPDGQYIAAPNATNGPVSSVAIISRGSWDSDISLIGHDNPCEVASFSPVLYEVESPGASKEKKISSVVATAGHDKSLAIWNNMYPRPVVVFEEFSMKTITDLCWTPDGSSLFVSSLDGTISVVRFEPGELGTRVSSEKNDELLNKYGVDKDSMIFPESTSQLILEDKAAEFAKTLSDKHMDRLMSLEKSQLEKQASQSPSARASTPPTPQKLDLKNRTTTTTQSPKPSDTKKLNRAVVTNGKKRVAPTLISTASHSTTNKFKEAALVSKTNKSITTTDKSVKSSKRLLSHTPYTLPKFGLQTSVNPYFIKKTSPEEEEGEDEGDEIVNYEEMSSEEETLFKKRKTKHHSIIKNIPLYEDTNIVYKRLQDPHTSHHATMHVLNYDETEEDQPTELISHEDGVQVIEHYIPDRVISITGQLGKYWTLATANGALLTFSKSGRALCPRIELGANVSFLASEGNFVVVITDDYMVHMFDVVKGKKIQKKVSMAPMLHYEDVVVGKSIKLSSRILDVELRNGVVVVWLDGNRVYYYDKELKSWVNALDNYYAKYNNTQNGLWVDKVNGPSGSSDVELSPEVEYVKHLTFLEGYEKVMDKIGKSKEATAAREEIKVLADNDLFASVRNEQSKLIL